jgi:UPF0042 nucleotide-binding protein
MSGSGKHTAFKAFEDLGYFCVDNLPVELVDRLIQLAIASGERIEKLAVVVDVRSGASATAFEQLFASLRTQRLDIKVIFFEASDEILTRRYSETRRVHPLARDCSLGEGFKKERAQLAEIRAQADMIVDTTAYTAHDLRNWVYENFRTLRAGERMLVSFVSFGFKRGLPHNADLVFDVRFLPNPNFVRELRMKRGNEPEIIRYMDSFSETGETIEKLADMLEYLLPKYEREGKSYFTVAVGCTGGHHRSVRITEALAKKLVESGWNVNVVHRDLLLS